MRASLVIASLLLAGLLVGGLSLTQEGEERAQRFWTSDTSVSANPVAPISRGTVDRIERARAAALDRVVAAVASCIEETSDYQQAVRVAQAEAAMDERREALLFEIVRALCGRNVDWAANFTLALPEGTARVAAIDIVADGLARHDADEALHWVLELPPGMTRSVALERIVCDLARTDPIRAHDCVTALPPSLVQDDALCSLASQMARQDPSRALAWAAGMFDGPVKPRILASIGFELAQLEPATARRLTEEIASPADRALLLASIRWSQRASPRSPLD